MPDTTLAAAIRTFILGDTAIAALLAGRVHYKAVPAPADIRYPFVWFERTSRQRDDTLDGDGMITHRFAMELVTSGTPAKPDGDGEVLADLIVDRLDGESGPLGSIDIDSIWVNDLDDNYVFKSVDDLDGLFVKAFDVEVIQ